MRALAALTVIVLLASADFAEARRGGFVSSLIRGGARAAAHGSGGSGGVGTYKSYGPDVLTVTQIEACVKRASELDRSVGILEARTQQIEAESTAIDRTQAELQRAKLSVDTYSAASVNAYNAKLNQLRTRINVHNSNIPQAKFEQAAHNSAVASYNTDCAKKYYQDDMDSVKLKLGLKDD